MTAKTEQRIKSWLAIAGQSISILTVVMILLYFPVKAKFNLVEARIAVIETAHEKHCMEQKERLKEYARLEVTNIKLEQICKDLSALFQSIERCQEKNEEFNNTLRDLISKLPNN